MSDALFSEIKAHTINNSVVCKSQACDTDPTQMHAASLLPSLSLALPFTSTPLSLSPTPHFPSLCLFSLHQTIILNLSLSLFPSLTHSSSVLTITNRKQRHPCWIVLQLILAISNKKKKKYYTVMALEYPIIAC